MRSGADDAEMTLTIQVVRKSSGEHVGDFRKLDVWQRAHELTCDVYRVTRRFPKEEQFGVVNQLRRAGVSVGSNIAEGCGRNNNGDFSRSLSIALGSANELLYLLILSNDLEFLPDRRLAHRAEESCRMLFRLHASVERDRRIASHRSD
jgi:four helix bundle protein